MSNNACELKMDRIYLYTRFERFWHWAQAALIIFLLLTGLLYWTYNSWAEWGLNIPLSTVGIIHTAGAFGLLVFLIVHVYMTTTGHNLICHMKAMITGWEEVPANGDDHHHEANGRNGHKEAA